MNPPQSFFYCQAKVPCRVATGQKIPCALWWWTSKVLCSALGKRNEKNDNKFDSRLQDSKTPRLQDAMLFVKRDNKDATKQGLTWIEMDWQCTTYFTDLYGTYGTLHLSHSNWSLAAKKQRRETNTCGQGRSSSLPCSLKLQLMETFGGVASLVKTWGLVYWTSRQRPYAISMAPLWWWSALPFCNYIYRYAFNTRSGPATQFCPKMDVWTELDNPEVGSTVYDAVYLLHIDYTISP